MTSVCCTMYIIYNNNNINRLSVMQRDELKSYDIEVFCKCDACTWSFERVQCTYGAIHENMWPIPVCDNEWSRIGMAAEFFLKWQQTQCKSRWNILLGIIGHCLTSDSINSMPMMYADEAALNGTKRNKTEQKGRKRFLFKRTNLYLHAENATARKGTFEKLC